MIRYRVIQFVIRNLSFGLDPARQCAGFSRFLFQILQNVLRLCQFFLVLVLFVKALLDLLLDSFTFESIVFGIKLRLEGRDPQGDYIRLVFEVLHLLPGFRHRLAPVAFRPSLEIHGLVGLRLFCCGGVFH